MIKKKFKIYQKDYKLKLIEDCAHAIESKYNNQHCGTFCDYGCFSFYATKNLVTGEGGMITSNKEKIISKLKSLALHGMNKMPGSVSVIKDLNIMMFKIVVLSII